jgi:FAD/FMN-containing dehydrogenase
MNEWINWSGSLRFTPREFLTPQTEDELCEIIKRSSNNRSNIRVAGAGHSSSRLVETSQTLVRLDHFKGIVRYNKEKGLATLKTGMTVHEANMELQKVGLALFNTGDIDKQMLAGAISTGTHGTGKKLKNLSSMLHGVRMIMADGTIKQFFEEDDTELMKAFRVSLGTLGVFTEITVKVLPLFKLRRMEIFTGVDECLRYFDQLADENRNVDFYWYPRSDEIKIRLLYEPEQGTRSFPFKFVCTEEVEGWAGDVLPKHRELKFDEMEYSLPAEAGLECFQQIREGIKQKHRKEIAWRVLYRTIAADENYLSPQYKRDTVSISLHHNAGLPFKQYFDDIEPVFRDYGGRPHWGKKHNLQSLELGKLYPEWKKFQELRKLFDPEEIFMNKYLQQLFV